MEQLQMHLDQAKDWWFSKVWFKENPEDSDEEMDEYLKDNDTSSQHSGNVVVLKVGIHCEECKRIVTDALWSMSGVDQVDVDKQTQKVTVSGRVSTKRVMRTVQRTGKCVELWKSYNAKPESYGGETVTVVEEDEEALCTIM